MRTGVIAVLALGICGVRASSSEPSKKQHGTPPVEVSNAEESKSAVRDLVKALSDPSNEVRANAAKALRPLIAVDPAVAPNWHDRSFWSVRIEKTKTDMLLDDALAILLPELSVEQREKSIVESNWDGGTGGAIYRLDDYWCATFQLKDYEKPLLIERPALRPSVREEWVKPAIDFTGLWVTWHVNGQKAREIQCKDGKYDGTYTAYYDDGSKAYQQHYKSQIVDGTDFGWFRSGKRMYEGQYKNGKQEGVWRHWHENGQLTSEETYKNGEVDGRSASWFENGQKRSETNYRDGKQNGLDAAWDERGKLLWKRLYRNGELINRHL